MTPVLCLILLTLVVLRINEGAPSNPFVVVNATEIDTLTKVTPLTLAATNYTCDSVSTKSYANTAWRLTLTKGTAKRIWLVSAEHNGSTGADATTTSQTAMGDPDTGTVDVTVSITLTGAGSTQLLNLVVNGATTGWTASTMRQPIIATPA